MAASCRSSERGLAPVRWAIAITARRPERCSANVHCFRQHALGDRPDTSITRISVKTRIPPAGANGQALISKLKDFTAGIKEVGRTKLEAGGSVDISIVAPHRYREEIVALYAADARKVTAALGDDYKIVTSGIDRPVQWVRMGLLELALFVPYSYQVVPQSVHSVTIAAD